MLDCTSLVMPDCAGLKREITRPLKLRQRDFHQKFDATTLFYDVFVTHTGREESLVFVGPPLRNLLGPLCRARFGGEIFGSLNSSIHLRDRSSDIWMHEWKGGETAFDFDWGHHSLAPRRAAHDLYRDKRVLYTLSKDNDVTWIVDWIRFHAGNHGADAVLLYDNGSTRYTADCLELALRYEFPAMMVNVVSWPFPYGPGGVPGSFWDSDFCQPGAFQDARFRFLDSAASVLNCDIDELVVSSRGASIFEATEASSGGYISFPGHWISTARPRSRDRETPQGVKHKQFYLSDLSKDQPCPRKWCVVPARCNRWCQWRAHTVTGKEMPEDDWEGFSYRHFQGISTDWKYPRSTPAEFDSGVHRPDDELRRAFALAGM